MKILCIADHVDPLVYSNSIKKRFGDVELVVSAGDLPLSYYDFIISNLNRPLLFVFGNHNLYTPRDPGLGDDSYGGATHIEVRMSRVKGLLVAGLGGSMWYNGEENQFTECQMFLRSLRLLPSLLWNRIFHGRFLDILVTHAPPFGIHDAADRCHTGFKTFLWFLRLFKPKYLVHGHIHLYSNDAERISRYQGTIVVNAYSFNLIELKP